MEFVEGVDELEEVADTFSQDDLVCTVDRDLAVVALQRRAVACHDPAVSILSGIRSEVALAIFRDEFTPVHCAEMSRATIILG